MRNPLRLSCALLALALTLALTARPGVAGSLSGVDALSSTIMEHNQTSFSGIAARLRLAPPAMMKGIEILPGIEYWRNTATLEIYDIHSERRDATLDADLRYRFPGSGWRPYVGAGFALHFLSSQVSAPGLGVPSASHSITKGGLAVLGGVSFPLAGAFDTFLEAKYHAITDYEQLKLSWGLAFNFR